MKENDFSAFRAAWLTGHEISSSNRTPSDAAVMAVFDLLDEYPLNYVLGALSQHSKNSRFAPTAADLVEIIGDRTGQRHIAADEAWSIVLESFDENATVILTQEIAEARGIALDIPDRIGQRMTFKAAYDRIVAKALPPKWFISGGFDPDQRQAAISRAIQLGRLPKSAGSQYKLDAPTTTVQALLEESAKRTKGEVALLKLQGIKDLLNMPEETPSQRISREKADFEKTKDKNLAKVKKIIGETV